MVATVSRETIEAYISGDVSGQVAVGSNNLQIGSIHGGVVNVAVPGQQPVPRLRPASALRPPKVPTQLLGREAQVSRVLAILASELPAEVHGQPGIGKTLLLKHLANHPDVPLPHVAYLRVRRQPLDDVLQSLFEAFYEWDGDVAVKPVGGQLRHHLAQARALVVLDDVDLEREDVQEVGMCGLTHP